MSTVPPLIHIGLHKTATRYFQHQVFAHLDTRHFAYNPEPIVSRLSACLRRPDDETLAASLDEAIRAQRQDPRRLVIAKAGLAGEMYREHEDHARNRAVLKRHFPEAEIVYFVRDQADWLVSAYKQSLQKGRCGPIEVFLNYRDGALRERLGHRVNGMRTVEALGLRFLAIYQGYVEAYGAEPVHLFRYEDFKRRPAAVTRAMAQLLGVSELPGEAAGYPRNRAFSSLALALFCPASRRHDVALRLEGDGVRPHFLRPVQKFGRTVRREFIRQVFDRTVYVDEDLLARHGMREQIRAHYAEENARLTAIAEAELARWQTEARVPDDVAA
jgi:hypothetical protein